MSKRQENDRITAETAILFMQECDHLQPNAPAIAATAAELFAIERALSALAVQSCNHGLSPAQEKRETRLIARVAEIADEYGVRLVTGGDARGPQLYLRTPRTRRSNTWGGEESGWAICNR